MFFIVGVVSLWLDTRPTKALDLSVKIMHFPTESSIYLIDFIRSDRFQMKIYVTGSDSLQTKCVCKRTAHFSGIISFEEKKNYVRIMQNVHRHEARARAKAFEYAIESVQWIANIVLENNFNYHRLIWM